MCRLLDTVKSDALSLLTITKEQKQKYESDVSRLKEENETLKASLVSMGTVMREKNELAEQVARLENYVRGLSESEASQRSGAEVEVYRDQLAAITEDRDTLRRSLTEASSKLTQVMNGMAFGTEVNVDSYSAGGHPPKAVRGNGKIEGGT